jgi:hypothetical protein
MSYYGTAAAYVEYFTTRGEVPPFVTEEIEAALLVASEWLDGSFRSMFPGWKKGERAQLREWPRTGAIDIYGYIINENEIPREILGATFEAASKHLALPGSLLVDFTPSKYKSASVDSAVSVNYMAYTNASEIQTQFSNIALILAPILTGFGNISALSGSSARK